MPDNDFREHTQGEFRGDFTRDTFYPLRHFTRVLMQQGRVQLDADWNEQVSILLHYLRSLACDVGGEHWGPTTGAGFEITSKKNEITISKGHYYVQGILCENKQPLDYTKQPDYPFKNVETPGDGTYLVYLDVWERHLTHVEVESPDDSVISIREVALGGPDTATRAQIVWQVKLKPLTNNVDQDFKKDYNSFVTALGNEKKPGTGSLRARAKKTEESKDPCLTAPESRYRGPENQLYRVEIHKGGVAWNGKKKDEDGKQDDAATFKWSRENGSVIFPIRQLAGTEVVVEHLGRDERSSLRQGDWVEVVDDDHVRRGEAGPLVQVIWVDRMEMKVTLGSSLNLTYGETTVSKHPLLRRWDQKSDAIRVSEGNEEKDWMNLEDGVQIQFPSLTTEPQAEYRTGDYWLIPARVATGDVEWPGPVNDPTPLYPHGVEHHYAPLAIISVDGQNITVTSPELRRKLKHFWE